MGAWRRDVFDRIGTFDEELVRNQDDEFNYRLRELGGRILLSDKIRSQYHNRSTLGSLWRQYFQYGYWKIRVMQKHPRQMQPRQFAPPMLALAIFGGAFLSPFSRLFRGLWFAALICYALANIAASLYTARKAGWRHLSLLPIVFATLHISYGLGFLNGLVKFRKRWGDKGQT
jgi:GT2 family glycosyltransferase